MRDLVVVDVNSANKKQSFLSILYLALLDLTKLTRKANNWLALDLLSASLSTQSMYITLAVDDLYAIIHMLGANNVASSQVCTPSCTHCALRASSLRSSKNWPVFYHDRQLLLNYWGVCLNTNGLRAFHSLLPCLGPAHHLAHTDVIATDLKTQE
jgi:hypothetical protein